jgi:mono/diheme cytochrome c family protein
MKMKFIQLIGLASVVITAFTFTGCVADSDSAGLEYMPDMYRSPAIEPYVDYAEIRGRENKALKTKLSAMTPPLGTIPFYGTNSEEVALMLPYFRNPSSEFWVTHGLRDFKFSSQNEYELAKEDTQNPLTLTAQNADKVLKEGKEIYASKCMHCHGEKGDGNGPIVKSGALAEGVVPNYAQKTDLSNGQMFYSIYYGKGAMGAHGSMLDKKEIWTLVHYVRKLQNKDYGTVKDGKVVGISGGSDSTAVKSTKTEKK